MQSLALMSLLFTATAGVPSKTSTVEIRQDGDFVRISIDAAPFAVYQTSRERPKPSFVEMRGPGGTVVSRPLSSAGGKDAHHHGLWIAVDDVNGVDFWHEKGRIVNHWLDADCNLVIRETTEIKFFANRLMAFDIALSAGERPVTFGDTEEGFLAFRVADSMSEEQSGRIVNAGGVETAAKCWGRASAWVDYSGRVDGKTFGVAIFDHPHNIRPSRYHVRDYGLFTISPFGEHSYSKGRRPAQPVVVPARSSLRLRHAIYVHSGDVKVGQVARVYREYVATPESPLPPVPAQRP